MESTDQYLGYIKYSGKLVEQGYMDARKSAQALIGFDEALRFYITHQAPHLKDLPYEIPVRIKKGTWGAWVPESIGTMIAGGVVLAATAYVSKAAQKMAENDFKDASIKKIFLKSLESIQWVIKIAKHTGSITQKKFKKVKFKNNNQEIGIPNQKNEFLFVPKIHFDAFVACPPKLFSNISDIVESERSLMVGVFKDSKKIEVKISIKEKNIFASKKDEEDILFPELAHGHYVELEGSATRGNETANSIGFKYNDHILTCYPANGSIVDYKNILFSKCKIFGHINREDKFGKIIEKRPKIIFNTIMPIQTKESSFTMPLFKK